jgi:hypothetical protein
MGFRYSVSLLPAIQATGALALTLARLTLAEHASLRWTNNPKKLYHRFVRVNWRAFCPSETTQWFSSLVGVVFASLTGALGNQPASRPVNGFPEFPSYRAYFRAPKRLDEAPGFGYPLPAYPALGQSRPGW